MARLERGVSAMTGLAWRWPSARMVELWWRPLSPGSSFGMLPPAKNATGCLALCPPDWLFLSPDGSALAVTESDSPLGDEQKVSLWQLDGGKRIRSLSAPKGDGKDAQLSHLCFTPDHQSLVCNSRDGKVLVFDLKSGLARAFPGQRDSQAFYDLAVSPDGKTLAVAVRPKDPNAISAYQGIQLWDIATGKLIRAIRALPNGGRVKTLAFARNGKMLGCTIENRVFVFDPATAKELTQIEAEMGQNQGLGFTPAA